MPVTFDGDNLLVVLPTATPVIDAQVDLYSDWKEWFKTGSNARYPLAFDTAGGDPTSATSFVAAYYFLRNDLGWRIRPAEEDATITIVGNLYPRLASLAMVIPPVGDFTTLVQIERDASSVVATVGSGVTEQDKIDIVDQVWDEARSGHVAGGSFGEGVAVAAISGSTTAASRLKESAQTMLVGAVDTTAFSPTTTQFECDVVLTYTGHIVGRAVFWRSGTLDFHAARIDGYSVVSGRGRLTVSTMPAAPSGGDLFVIV